MTPGTSCAVAARLLTVNKTVNKTSGSITKLQNCIPSTGKYCPAPLMYMCPVVPLLTSCLHNQPNCSNHQPPTLYMYEMHTVMPHRYRATVYVQHITLAASCTHAHPPLAARGR